MRRKQQQQQQEENKPLIEEIEGVLFCPTDAPDILISVEARNEDTNDIYCKKCNSIVAILCKPISNENNYGLFNVVIFKPHLPQDFKGITQLPAVGLVAGTCPQAIEVYKLSRYDTFYEESGNPRRIIVEPHVKERNRYEP